MQRAALLAVVTLPMTLLLASAAAATTVSAGTGTVTVGVSTDAWYAASSACTASPTGCLPAAPPASPYPAKSLQIGVAAGQEESRAYLTLNLAALPAGTSLTGGTLRLPVGGNQDGSVSPDMATLQACLATGTIKDDVEGSADKPPAVDCKGASSKAKYAAAAGSVPEMFTVDLTPFASAWSAGSTSQGIALIPADDTAAPSTWHVSLSAHDRDVPAPQHISATVFYASSAGDVQAPASGDVGATPATTTFDSGSASFAAPPLAPVPSAQLPANAPPATPEIAAQAPPVAPVQVQQQAAVTVGGFAYPGVFLLPILIAVVGGWLARALTRDLTPAF
ncbi:MAG: hypothetical protein QOJ79_2837 [Actinomycetota bacterium]|nr:hypothetical protein [Actinomycetota bacterium]